MGMEPKDVVVATIADTTARAIAARVEADRQRAVDKAARKAALEEARDMAAIDKEIRDAGVTVPVLPVVVDMAARMSDNADLSTIARELGTSLAEVQADIELEATTAREYRAMVKAERAERVEVNRTALTALKASRHGALLDTAYRAIKGRAAYVVATTGRKGVEVHALVKRDSERAVWEVTRVYGAKTVQAYSMTSVPLIRKRVDRMPKRYADNGPSAKRVRDTSSEVETTALEIAGASFQAIAAVRAEYARIKAEYDRTKVGSGTVADDTVSSVLSETEQRERARARKAEYRARKRMDMGKIARGYNKGGLGR